MNNPNLPMNGICLICGEHRLVWTYNNELSLKWVDMMLESGWKKKDFSFYNSPYRFCITHYLNLFGGSEASEQWFDRPYPEKCNPIDIYLPEHRQSKITDFSKSE